VVLTRTPRWQLPACRYWAWLLVPIYAERPHYRGDLNSHFALFNHHHRWRHSVYLARDLPHHALDVRWWFGRFVLFYLPLRIGQPLPPPGGPPWLYFWC